MYAKIDHFFGEIDDSYRVHSCTDYTVYIVQSPGIIYKRAERIKFLTDASCREAVNIEFTNQCKNSPIPKGSNIHIVQPCKYSMNDIRKHYTIKRSADSADYVVFGEKPEYARVQLLSINSCLIDEKEKVIVASYNKKTKAELLQEYMKYVGKNNDLLYFDKQKRLYGFPTEEYMHILTKTFNKPFYLLDSLDITNENELTPELLYMIYMANKNEFSKESESNLIVLLNTLNNTNWREHKDVVAMVLSTFTESYWNRPKNCKHDVMATMKIHRSKYPKQITELLMLKGNSTVKNKKLLKDVMENILHIGDKKFVDFVALQQRLYKEFIPAWAFTQCYNTICKVTPINEES